MTLPRSPSFHLNGRRALVAGASSGIRAGVRRAARRAIWTVWKIGLNRTGRATDIMGTAACLALDAARLIAGPLVIFNGGWTAD